MFEELNHPRVQLMLALSKERMDDREQRKQQLLEVDMEAFFQLCREHERNNIKDNNQ